MQMQTFACMTLSRASTWHACMQAFGCGAFDVLGVIFQRTCMFMLAHCLPITLVQLGVPHLLRAAGEDPALCGLSAQYALRLLPSLYIEAFNRPLNRILIAQVCCRFWRSALHGPPAVPCMHAWVCFPADVLRLACSASRRHRRSSPSSSPCCTSSSTTCSYTWPGTHRKPLCNYHAVLAATMQLHGMPDITCGVACLACVQPCDF